MEVRRNYSIFAASHLKLMITNRISTNLYVAEDPRFGNYNKDIVYRLLQQVQIDFSNWIGNDVFHTSDCIISYKDECPTIYDNGQIGHKICLHVSGDDWWRWVYQFSHEYCHHLINGTMSGDISGMIWFEEAICDLSAIAHLKRLIVLCDVLRIDSLLSYKDYVILCLHANLGSAQKNCREYLRSNMATLEQPVYQREIYSNLSATILPFFEENNHLWKIILHFGDMRKWDYLEDLFDHLLHTSDDSYSVSLRKLYNLLL